MIKKQPDNFVLVRLQICITDRMGLKVAFGILFLLTLSLSGGKPPSFESPLEKLAWAISPSLSQGVGVQIRLMNLVACDEVEHNIKRRKKSRGAEKPVDCGVGKLTPNNLTQRGN